MDKFAEAVFAEMGGTQKVADFFGVTRVAAHTWKRDGFPKSRMMFLMEAPRCRHIVKKAKARLVAQEASSQETTEA